MQRNEGEAQGDELRSVADRLAASMTEALRSGGVASETNTAQAAESLAAKLTQSLGSNRDGAAGGVGSLGAAVQNLESVTKRLGGPLGWMASLNPLLGLLRLFGGGGKPEAVELPKYDRPARQDYLGGIRAESGWSMREADYGAGWQARAIGEERAAAPAQVTVQVQAMDSRSFLDHRDEIAAAVRQALLESHSLGDVMGER
ncbi:MAG: hypothetical protein KJZ84_05945 [Bryobacteraceae bacterium]|nr:hypothetical protein [Bryobacteraceae bacterium]